MEDPVVLLEWNLYGHFMAGLSWEFEKVLLKCCWEKVPNWERFFGHFLFCVSGRYLIGWKEAIYEPNMEIFMKDVDVGEPTSFLDHVYLGCSHRECQINKDFVDNYRNMFESRISVGAKDKLSVSGKSDANISSWSCDMEVMQRSAWKDIANWRTKQLNTYTKSQHHALTTTSSKKKK